MTNIGLEKLSKNDKELLSSFKELLLILGEDIRRIKQGNKERIRVVSACLRVLAADTHPLSTQGLLNYFSNQYSFTELVDGKKDLENFLDSRILFDALQNIGSLSLRELIKLSSENDGLAHESLFRAPEKIKYQEKFKNYRLWLTLPENAREDLICNAAFKIKSYGDRLVQFLEKQDLDQNLIQWPKY